MNSTYRRDTDYWNKYYSVKKDIPQHSLFADYILKYLTEGCSLLEIGCGNGRDSIWFSQNNICVSCIDASDVAISEIKNNYTGALKAICGDFVENDIYQTNHFDAVYSRFSIHSIDDYQEQLLLNNVYKCLNTNGIFAIEVRSVNDSLYGKGKCVGRNAYVYDNHYRRFILIDELICKLIKSGFSIKYAEESKGFAPFNGEDSYVIRIVAKK